MSSVSRCLLRGGYAKLRYCQKRFLNLLECQSKVLLQNYGVNVQKFVIIENSGEAIDLESRLKAEEYVIKAQILAGGRGLGRFDSGLQGGVHLTKDALEAAGLVDKMLGHRLVTKQTRSDGIAVKKVMIAESVDIARETYLALVMDRKHDGPVVVASPSGGMDIENVAERSPHLLATFPIDITVGISPSTASKIAEFLGFRGTLAVKAADEIKRLYELFLNVDATQVEINPLVETSDGQVVSVDAKINFDDNARFRQKAIFLMDDHSETDPRELEAVRNGLNYIRLEGDIGCLVNGAGLAMATMDIIKLHGGEPANFLDVGGGVDEHQVLTAFTILTSDPQVKAILVNVFGGIVNCGTIARGLVAATERLRLSVPLIVRLEGTDVENGRDILQRSGLPIKFASDLDQAARTAVESLN